MAHSLLPRAVSVLSWLALVEVLGGPGLRPRIRRHLMYGEIENKKENKTKKGEKGEFPDMTGCRARAVWEFPCTSLLRWLTSWIGSLHARSFLVELDHSDYLRSYGTTLGHWGGGGRRTFGGIWVPGLFHSSIVGSSLGGGYRSGKVSGVATGTTSSIFRRWLMLGRDRAWSMGYCS